MLQINDLVMIMMKFSFDLCVLCYKRYNEVRLLRSKFACPQQFVINVRVTVFGSVFIFTFPYSVI